MAAVPPPTGGIYMSKWMAGIIATLLTLACAGAFTNLWALNKGAILFNAHMEASRLPTATLPGALSKSEWNAERRLLTQELETISDQIENLHKDVRGIQK